jgi:hypothetical protein
MRPFMKGMLAALSLALVVVGCRELPTAATRFDQAPEPPPGPVTDGSWRLVSTVTSVTPNACWTHLEGLVWEWPLTVNRWADSVQLAVDWGGADGVSYSGSLAGNEFSLVSPYRWNLTEEGFHMRCTDGKTSIRVILQMSVAGRFSEDGRAISAEEVASYHVPATRELIEVRHRWVAVAPAPR